jgi:UPF0755 protein
MIVVGTLLVAAIAAVVILNYAREYPSRRNPGSGEEVIVEIESGMSFPRIAERLAERGVIERPSWFRLYAMKVGATTKVRTGRYVLRDNMTPEEVLARLMEGVKEKTTSVLLPEGKNMLEFFELIEAKEIASAKELEALARDSEFLEEHGISADTVEGYLFPDTYRFKVPTPANKVLETLIARHKEVWAAIRRDHAQGFEKVKKRLSWNEHDFLIMASIVEKEAVAAKEQPTIAQVFMNRLISPKFVPHRLDTDPTIRYGCMVPIQKSAACREWDKTDRLHRKQLDDVDNPYNTYQHEGLPPGPISNPGRGALTAVVNPDGTNYFFFVSQNDGTHVFSRTRAEHERNVDKFQR